MENKSTHTCNKYLCTSHKISILVLFIYSITLANLLAQGKLKEGYIITNQNDTIRGLIKDESWTKSPEIIEFKIPQESIKVISAFDIKGFSILSTNQIYKSKKVGLLDITMNQVYLTAPSLETKDSAQVFLEEITTGSKAVLYEFLNASEQPHYFIEKNNLLKELYNYPFQKSIENRAYLLVYDDYKRQLTNLCGDVDGFKASIPPYQRKFLKQYIEKYNSTFPGERQIFKPKNNALTFDVDLNTGLENWNQPPVIIDNKFTYGIGLRINFPRKFQNRYLKFNFFVTPGVLKGPQFSAYETTSLKTLEIAIGSHFGAGKVRPFLGFQYSGVYQGHRPDFVGFQAGISYKRRISLEVGHFVNFNIGFSKSKLFTPPRISLHYMINLPKWPKRI